MVKYRTPDGKEGYASPDRVPAGAIVESEDYRPEGSVVLDRTPRRKPVPVKKKAAPTAAGKKASDRVTELSRDRWSRKAERARAKLAEAERDYEQWRVRCRGVEERRSLYEVPPGCSTYEKGKLDAAAAKLEEARDWADDGLYDACRRDENCLPGYIR